MKTLLKILGHGLAMLILWIVSTLLADATIGLDVESAENEQLGLLFMYLTCLLNVSVVHYFLIRTHLSGPQRFWRVFVIVFGIQFFMSQMETLFFIDESVLSTSTVMAIVLSGFLLSVGYAGLVVKTYGGVEKSETTIIPFNNTIAWKLALLTVIIYPALYFLAGYFIAWQSESLRLFYSGSTELLSFGTMMSNNLREGLYVFQIFRGFLWLAFGWVILTSVIASRIQAMITLGLLFAILMNAQHLIPNPMWSDEIRLYHFVETASSNFLWGAIAAYFLYPSKVPETGLITA